MVASGLSRRTCLSVLTGILLAASNSLCVSCSSSSNQTAEVPAGWLKLDAGPFSIYAPPGWAFHPTQSVDSFQGMFAGNGFVLYFDFGLFSNPLADQSDPLYLIVHERIGGYRAKIVSPRTPGHGTAGISIPTDKGAQKLCLYGRDLSEAQQAVALRIFRTIQFKSPPGSSPPGSALVQ